MPDLPPRPKLQITSTHTVYSGSSAIEPLSLTSSAATMWPETPPVMFFRARPDPAALQRAFEAVVAAYPILGARLTTTPPTTSGWGAHTTRHARGWAYHDGPGATLRFAEWDGPLSDVLPSGKGRVLKLDPAVAELCATDLVVLRPDALARPGPPFAAQLTVFHDGVALALKIFHALADAHTAIALARDWLETYNAIVDGKPRPELKGTYGQAVNAAARGDIDADAPDAALVAEAERLPGLRLDTTRAAPNSNPMPIFSLAAAPDIEGDMPPWESWDWMAPVAERVLRFSDAELDKIHSATAGVSRLDALLARLWGAIVRARGLGPHDEVSLSSCVGLRSRVESIGDEAYGSPLLIPATVLDAAAAVAPTAARAIRSTVSMYTPESIGAELHRMAFVADPPRRLTFFFGRYHSFSTSWLRLGAYEAEMGGVRPEWVLTWTPGSDGLICVLEAREGVNVQLWLEEGVMARVLADPAITNI